METGMLTNVMLFLFCLCLLCFYQGVRTAFLYSFKYREHGRDSESLIEKLIADFYHSPGIILLSMSVASIAFLLVGVWLEYVCLKSFNVFPVAWVNVVVVRVIILMTFLFFGFIIPRQLCGRKPDKALKILAVPFYLFGILLLPLTRMLYSIPHTILNFFGVKVTDTTLAHLLGGKELMSAHLRPALTVDEPDIREKDLQIFRNALEFSNVRVRDCIVPRTEIIAVDIGDSVDQLINTFINSGKTKIIVYREDVDHIVGYIHSSEMFRSSVHENWTDSVREIPLVPESMSAQKMMQIFMQQKKSIAVVVDEFGGTSGIISLEDLVEEIFGDIEDEHDVDTYTARRMDNGEYLLSARLEVEKVNEQFHLNLPESDDYLTLGGLILFYYQDFPKEGQTVTIQQFNFTILKTTTSKIDLIKLKVNA